MSELLENIPRMLRTPNQVEQYTWIVTLLHDNGVAIKLQDAPSLATFAINLSLLEQCADSLAVEGAMMTVRGDKGLMVSKVNPCVALQKEAQTALRFYFKEFEMSPASRGSGKGGGLGVIPKDKESEKANGGYNLSNL